MKGSSKLRAGEWVEVRSREEILATLDADGCLGGMPFMPEMLAHCGRRFRVFKRAHKTCDTVHKTGGRKVEAAVHLQELRCDGSAHGGCQAGCLLFWKDAWLKPLAPPNDADSSDSQTGGAAREAMDESDLAKATRQENAAAEGLIRYRCQATQLPAATSPLHEWDLRQYWEDVRSGNVTWREFFGPFFFGFYDRLINLGIGWGPLLRWLYDGVQRWLGGHPYPRRVGLIPAGQSTPGEHLGLQPGERVRVKKLPEILCTLDTNNRNKGLYFDAEEVPFCGREFTVLRRVQRIINEQTGAMMEFRNESVILDGVYCGAKFSHERLHCPRAIYPMWREIWLERAKAGA